MPTIPRNDTRSGDDELLLSYLVHLSAHRTGRRAVLIRLSRLLPHNRRSHHVRTAISGFETRLSRRDGQFFVLGSSDVLVVYRSEAHAIIEEEIRRVRYLFSDDPLFQDNDSRDSFTVLYNIDAAFGPFVDAIRSALRDTTEKPNEADFLPDARERIRDRQLRGEALTPDVLAKIEAALAQTDLSSLAHQQTVCVLNGQQSPAPRFRELYISISDLRDAVLPGADFTANPWLFRHLTKTLDQRVLSLLSMPEQAGNTRDISININISTLISEEFRKFENGLNASRPNAFIFELQAPDIFSDIEAYLFVRDHVQNKGWRICLDGLTCADIDLYDVRGLGVDLVKIVWDQRMPALVVDARERLAAMVREIGSSRAVLCRVDSRVAVDFGHAIGFSMFQGRYVEQLVSQDARRRRLSLERDRAIR
ncbi:MAG: EAL domain-containing protein [Rhodospirillales bacterium]|nr:EAL domain-containing protein [Rhodospirillales bacterium]